MPLGNILSGTEQQYVANKDDKETWRILNTWHEDLKKLQDEKKKLAEFRERQQALEAQLSAAKSAPIVIDGQTINVNEGGKTENNVSHPPAMVPNGTTGQLARGGGYMGVDYF